MSLVGAFRRWSGTGEATSSSASFVARSYATSTALLFGAAAR